VTSSRGHRVGRPLRRKPSRFEVVYAPRESPFSARARGGNREKDGLGMLQGRAALRVRALVDGGALARPGCLDAIGGAKKPSDATERRRNIKQVGAKKRPRPRISAASSKMSCDLVSSRTCLLSIGIILFHRGTIKPPRRDPHPSLRAVVVTGVCSFSSRQSRGEPPERRRNLCRREPRAPKPLHRLGLFAETIERHDTDEATR